MTEKPAYIGFDQYGNTYKIGRNPPRKWLMAHFCRSRAQKMYVDTTSGAARHVGWIVAGHWINVHRVEPLHAC